MQIAKNRVALLQATRGILMVHQFYWNSLSLFLES